uniref:Uncharacterized protein n=1 Tax=viral metagenome TaxID=1070528 RepID=A0A6C0HZQ1_9ZZZZ
MEIFLLNFLPIIIIFLLVSYTDTFANMSSTILGKLFAIILIIFYIKHDKLIGLFVCLLVIYYYQTDFIVSFDWLKNSTFENVPSTSRLHPAKLNATNRIIETMVSNDKEQFTKKYCQKGHLMHKGIHVSNEMSEHVFHEIKQTNEFNKCNICDPACDFSIINRKIDIEEVLVKPKGSNDWVNHVWENMSFMTSTSK